MPPSKLRLMSKGRPLARVIYPGAEASLREAVTRIGAGPETLMTLARTGVVEVLALDRLRSDETRVLERELLRAGAQLFSDTNGERAIAVAPLAILGELSSRVRQFSDGMEPLARAISDALVGRGAPPPPWQLAGEIMTVDRCRLIGRDAGADLQLSSGIETRGLQDAVFGMPLPLASALRVAASDLAHEERRHELAASPAGLLVAVPIESGADLDSVLVKLTATVCDLVDSLAESGIATARLALQPTTTELPSVALLDRLEQLRALRLPLALDCRDPSGAPAHELVRLVLAARAGVRLLVVDHVSEASAALNILGLR